MNLQENIQRIHEIMGGVITEVEKKYEEPSVIKGYHGSNSLTEEFYFPLFLTTSKHRGLWFASSMRWNEKLNKNVMHPLKGGEEGYLYHIRVENPIIKKWEGGPSDEKLIEGGEITILGVEKVGVTGFPNQYHPYVIEKII